MNALSCRRASLVGLALLLVVLVSGCDEKGKVKGKVIYNKKPLSGGRLTFRPSDPKAPNVWVEIGDDGTYEVTLPAGDVKVAFENAYLAPPKAPLPSAIDIPMPPEVKEKIDQAKAEARKQDAGDAAKSSKYVKIPERYSDPDKSNLDFTVEAGEQEHDIEIRK